MKFKLDKKYEPAGDQPTAIKELIEGINANKKHQVLLGATGTGKTFTIANVINEIQKPTLVLAHNKTLAGQLYGELKELFPNNHVEYFVSYYDYYQPEAYVASSDTFIEKDASINEEIDELRHSATSSLIGNKDVIVVSSVSCIYGIGEVEDYKNKFLVLKAGQKISREEILEQLVKMLYERNEIDFKRGTFRAKGDVIEIIQVNQHSKGIRLDLFGDEIEKIIEFDTVTGHVIESLKTITILPASHYVTDDTKLEETINRIEEELEERLKELKSQNKLLEHQRLKERTKYDLEMLKETGFCRGIENYSRHLALKNSGATPTTLMDFFGEDYLLVVDESHVTIPQVRGMYNGDRARKSVLIDYGFRLPSAIDNRPLQFEEFEKKINQVVYVSATPGDYELEKTNQKIIEQIIRPTGLLDPEIEIRPSKNQIDDLINQINLRKENNERTIITTLTIRMSEELTAYLEKQNVKVTYLHSEIKTLERLQIINDLRRGTYDVIVGINLLREGLDMPEVSLVAILDADKQGFLRSDKALIQTIGRAARNANGKVIMYADTTSDAMKKAISETNRRRQIQEAYNIKHNITPTTISKKIAETITTKIKLDKKGNVKISATEKKKLVSNVEREMNKAAKTLDFERAAELRDVLFELKSN